jgi:hypothetical protein
MPLDVKESFGRIAEWAKKNPAIAVGAVGGVALLAFMASRGGLGAKTASGQEDTGLAGGLGGDEGNSIGSGEFVFPQIVQPGGFIVSSPSAPRAPKSPPATPSGLSDIFETPLPTEEPTSISDMLLRIESGWTASSRVPAPKPGVVNPAGGFIGGPATRAHEDPFRSQQSSRVPTPFRGVTGPGTSFGQPNLTLTGLAFATNDVRRQTASAAARQAALYRKNPSISKDARPGGIGH